MSLSDVGVDVLADRSGRSADPRTRAPRPTAMQTTVTTNGHTMATEKSRAPTAGPTSWLPVIMPAIRRALAMPRSRLSTSIGVSVPAVASTNVSAVPRASMATSTMAMLTCPVAITAHRPASTSPRTALATIITSRRSSRSASAPAKRPDEQPRRLEGHHRRGDEDRAPGLRGDEQRTGCDQHAVAEVGHPRRPDEPAEAGAQTRREDGLDKSAHKRVSLRQTGCRSSTARASSRASSGRRRGPPRRAGRCRPGAAGPSVSRSATRRRRRRFSTASAGVARSSLVM